MNYKLFYKTRRPVPGYLPGKLTVLLVTAMFSLCLFAGCDDKKGKEYRIGVSQCSGDYWRERTNEDMQRELLAHDDTELVIRNADSDNQRQIDDIRYFMDNGFDLILVSPNETDPLTPIVREAYERGIPVVTFDRSVRGDSVTAHIEVDNYALGQSVAHYTRSSLRGDINILEIQGPESASPAQRRHAGFLDGIRGCDNMRVTASVYGNWDDGRSEMLTDSLLSIYPEINMIYAHTDHMGIGASRAVKRHDRDDIAIMGIDGFPHIGIQAVKDGNLTATFLYPTEGERLLKIALSIVKGEPYEKVTKIPPLSPIDKSNADIILSQEALLAGETSKINLLKGELNTFLDKYSSQRMLLWAAVTILVLLGLLIFSLLKAIRENKRHQRELLLKNSMLEEEKEKQAVLYDKLQVATQSKLTFFTNVSHDLRTPLTLVSGPVEQVAEVDYLTPRDKSLMNIALKNIHILRRLINQILDFRKYENGKVELTLSEANLPALLREWTDTFREVARRRDIRLAFSGSDNAHDDLTIALDVEMMERVFFNLMSNAFKHTPDNGKVSVTFDYAPDKVSFSVIDNGEGIAREDLPNIFDNFFQADKVSHGGSGIGLAVTKAFIELHGGSITVESEKGKGSVFTVTLPVRHCGNDLGLKPRITPEDVETELAPVQKDVADFDDAKPLLLIIDDNRDIQRLITNLLGDTYNYIYAADGLQGVNMATKYVPDLIICDVMMPVMDGLECVRRLKSQISTSHIPVLMLTACSMDEQRAEGYDSGADGYISKPFNAGVLDSRVRNLLESRKRIEQLYGNAAKSMMKATRRDRKVIPGHTAPNDVESDFYSRFAEIVDERLSDPNLTVEEVASRLNLSQSQFTRKIKALTNYTPVEIIRNMRLQHAVKLLRSTEKTVSEIAFESGFTSLAYFSRCYKDAFGETPSDSRPK